MAEISRLCVYCGSSSQVDPRYLDAAANLGRKAAQQGIGIVFGGGRVGLMGVLADAAIAAGGEVIGVIPSHLESKEVGHQAITRLEVVETMHERKARMCDLADGFCILPGGMGTLDETFEIVTWKQLGLHDKPIVVANIARYWAPLLDLVEHMLSAGFVRPQHAGLFDVAFDIDGVFDRLRAAPPPRTPTRTAQF